MKALAALGHQDRVFPIIDDLSYGPIDVVTAEHRGLWASHELGVDAEPEYWPRRDARWAEAAADAQPVVWFSRNSANEHAGFLELLWRRGDAPTSIVDVTDLVRRRPDGCEYPVPRCIAFAQVGDWQIVNDDLVGDARAVSEEERERYRATWRDLRKENAALRVVESGSLLSAPITHFDTLLMSQTSDAWQILGRLIGNILSTILADELLLWSRVDALIEQGVLEVKGERTSFRDTWVRRRA